jgi:hypothetical protein
MTAWSSEHRARVAATLGTAGRLADLGGNLWQLNLHGAPALSAEVTWDGEWLRLARVVDTGRPPESLWQTVVLQLHVSPEIKLTITPTSRLLAIADIAAVRGVDLAARIDAACRGLRHAGAALDDSPATEEIEDTPLPDDLRLLCTSSGWKVTNRSAGRVAVDLDTGDNFAQAIVEHHRGMVVVSTSITDEDEIASAVCREAVGLMLLRLNDRVRLVRGVAGPGTRAPRLEVRMSNPSGAELERILGALSVAWSTVGREVPLLGADEDLARLFLQHSRAAGAERRATDQHNDH